MSVSPRYRGACGRSAGATPSAEWSRSKNCTIVKPNPISATEVRTHDIIVRSRLRRVRIHAKWLSEVTLTSSPCGCITLSAIIVPFEFRRTSVRLAQSVEHDFPVPLHADQRDAVLVRLVE